MKASSAISSRFGFRPCCISRDAATRRSLRVRRFWFALPFISVLRQLLHDGGEVEPHVLAADIAIVAKLDHMQQAEFELPSPAFKAEGTSGCRPAPHRLVHQEVLAIEALSALHLAVGKVGEKRLVETACAVAA